MDQAPTTSEKTAPLPANAASRGRVLLSALWRRRIRLAGAAAVIAFIVMVGRFWHPYYGMTRLIQLDAGSAAVGIPEIRRNPVFSYPDHGGYDGIFYAQYAYDPTLRTPGFEQAIDNPSFRARRILLSATAWAAALGQERWIADVFSSLNIAAWLGLAWVLWRLLGVRDLASFLGWAGVMFSAGALHSVRQSLTDLPVTLLIALAMQAVERGRLGRGVGLVAAAALTRETGVLAAVGLWRTQWRRPSTWIMNGAVVVLVSLPLALWLVYVRQRFGPQDAGMGNFSRPMLGWWDKWPEVMAAYENPVFRWLVTTTLLATIGLTAQMVFFVAYRKVSDGWWRIGALHAVLAAFLGRAVWEGHPGAFTRVLLPMSLAFAVCAVRWRAPTAWLVVGGLSVFAGIEPWRDIVVHREDLASGRIAGAGYLVDLRDGWFPREQRRFGARAWSSGHGSIEVETTRPLAAEVLHIRLDLRAYRSDRRVRIIDGQGETWSGTVGNDWQPIEFLLRRSGDADWFLEFRSDEPAVREGDSPGARELSFAIRAVDIRAGP